MLGISSNNAALPIAANGNFCTLVVPFPPAINQGSQVSSQLLDTISYFVSGGAGIATGTFVFQILCLDGVWRTLPVPAPVTLVASTAFSGSIVGAYHGIRLTIAALTGGVVTYAEISSTISNP